MIRRFSTAIVSPQRAFTIIELMVTLSIVVLVTGAVMLRYASFNSSVLLTSQAYRIAFDIRETQSLAISVRGTANEFRQEYGMFFSMAHPSKYILFQDADDMNPPRYTPSQNEAIGADNVIDPRFVLVDICGVSSTGNRRCYSDDGVLQHASIAFSRPNFNALIYGYAAGVLSEVELIIAASTDASLTRSIFVTQSGQVRVE